MWGVNVVSPSEAMLQHCVSLPGGYCTKYIQGGSASMLNLIALCPFSKILK